MYYAGLDIGSTMTKVVVVDDQGGVINYILGPTGPEHRPLANMVMQRVLEECGLTIDDVGYIVATGYGRVSVPFADSQTTEITCHARGVNKIFPEAGTVIDIGGQDCKAIQIKEGRVKNFVMNDRCAAGTGRFLEIIAESLGLELGELGQLASQAEEKIKISNICTVFAVQEIMAYLAQGIAREAIIAGLLEGIAIRVFNMASKIGLLREVVVTGGGAKNEGLIRELRRQIGMEVYVPEEPLITGALGAALIAREKGGKILARGGLLPQKKRTLEKIALFS